MNPTSPNANINNKQSINLNINISINKNTITCDKSTQTEDIFFNYSWRNFIGKYKIITPKIDKYGIMCQLKPIKFNSIKSSYSYANKKDILFNSSIMPIPQTIDTSSRKQRENIIFDIIKKNRVNYDNVSPKQEKGNRNISMIPFGPLFNDLIKNHGHSYDKNNNINRINAVNFKRQNLINCPVVKAKSIFLKKMNDKTENH